MFSVSSALTDYYLIINGLVIGLPGSWIWTLSKVFVLVRINVYDKNLFDKEITIGDFLIKYISEIVKFLIIIKVLDGLFKTIIF